MRLLVILDEEMCGGGSEGAQLSSFFKGFFKEHVIFEV